jgi:hypothetical protein
MDEFNPTDEFVNIDPLVSTSTTSNKENSMPDTTPTVETAVETKTNAMLDLIGAGQRMTVTEEIPHVKNLTFFSGMALINGAEGKRGKMVTEHLKVVGILKTILDFSVASEGAYLPVIDQEGLLQLKVTFNAMANAADDIDNIGVVNAQYTGKYADRIVGLSNVAMPTADDADELDVAMAAQAWYRLGWVGGQIKIQRHLVNVDAKADESDDITHMRKQLYRAIAARTLLQSEATDTPIVLKWGWLNSTEIAYYVKQFSLGTKERYEQKREHIAKQQVYKSDVRTSIAIQKIEEAGEVFTPKTQTVRVRTEGGTIETDVNTLIGQQYVRFLGSIKLGGVLKITEENAGYTAESLRKNGASIALVS